MKILKNTILFIYDKIYNNPLENDNEDKIYSFFDFLRQSLERDINKRININKALDNFWIKGA